MWSTSANRSCFMAACWWYSCSSQQTDLDWAQNVCFRREAKRLNCGITFLCRPRTVHLFLIDTQLCGGCKWTHIFHLYYIAVITLLMDQMKIQKQSSPLRQESTCMCMEIWMKMAFMKVFFFNLWIHANSCKLKAVHLSNALLIPSFIYYQISC